MNKELEIIIHKNQSTLYDFDYDIKMTISEFNARCIPSEGALITEFELRPIDIAIKDGVPYTLNVINNEVYFKIIK